MPNFLHCYILAKRWAWIACVNIKKYPNVFFGYKFCSKAGLLLGLQFGIDLAAVKATTDHGG